LRRWRASAAEDFAECITLVVFTVVAFILFRSPVKRNYLVSYALIIGAVFFPFKF
jgi:hypothetical protein